MSTSLAGYLVLLLASTITVNAMEDSLNDKDNKGQYPTHTIMIAGKPFNTITPLSRQKSIRTEHPTNLALETSSSFFIASDEKGWPLYTRVGTFMPTHDGYMVNHLGYYLNVVMQEHNNCNPLTSDQIAASLTPLNLSRFWTTLIQSTSYMNLFAGLPSGAQVGAPANTQAKLVFDQKGNQYNVVMSYQKVDSYTVNGGGLPTDNPAPGGPADAPDSERWVLSATATTNTKPPVPVTVSAAWNNGIGIVFQNGVPILINEGNALPTMDITPNAATAVDPIVITVNPGTLNKSDGLTVLGGLNFNNKDIGSDGSITPPRHGFFWDINGNGVMSNNHEEEKICFIPIGHAQCPQHVIPQLDGTIIIPKEAGKVFLSPIHPSMFKSSAIEKL